MSCEETLDQFSSCWDGLEDPRNGNACQHDFYEPSVMTLCAAAKTMLALKGATETAYHLLRVALSAERFGAKSCASAGAWRTVRAGGWTWS